MEWALVGGIRARASASGSIGTCPGCGGEVRAHCGDVLAWHWAHINADCDPWSEPESEWHRQWKGYFPPEWQEVTKPPHRADIAGPSAVIEVQRSAISPREINEREVFYGRMAWILNGNDFWKNLEWIEANGSYHEFRWKHARKSWLHANRQIFIDTPLGLFKVKRIRDSSWVVVCGSFVEATALVSALDKAGNTIPSPELFRYDMERSAARDELLANAETLKSLYEKFSSLSGFDSAITAREYFLIEAPKWRDWRTVNDYLKSATQDQAQILIDYYTNEIAKLSARVERERIADAGSRINELMDQSAPLAQEWRRPELINQFLRIRPAPICGFGALDTPMLQSCLDSLIAAKQRSPHHFPTPATLC